MKYLKNKGISVIIYGNVIIGEVSGTSKNWSLVSTSDIFKKEVPLGILHSTLTHDPESTKFQIDLADIITKEVRQLLNK